MTETKETSLQKQRTGKFETNDTLIAVNILFVPHNEEEIKKAYFKAQLMVSNPSNLFFSDQTVKITLPCREKPIKIINPLMHNVLKCSDTL